MRVLVTGDRNWDDREFLWMILSQIHKKHAITLLIHGNAKGADSLAEEWAKANEIEYRGYPAKWGTHHRAAGPIRNRRMLDDASPDFVAGFHNHIEDSKGTKDMLSECSRRNIPNKLFKSFL